MANLCHPSAPQELLTHLPVRIKSSAAQQQGIYKPKGAVWTYEKTTPEFPTPGTKISAYLVAPLTVPMGQFLP